MIFPSLSRILRFFLATFNKTLTSTDSGGFKLGTMTGTESSDLGNQVFTLNDTATDGDGDSASGTFDITIGNSLDTLLGSDDDGSTTGV